MTRLIIIVVLCVLGAGSINAAIAHCKESIRAHHAATMEAS